MRLRISVDKNFININEKKRNLDNFWTFHMCWKFDYTLYLLCCVWNFFQKKKYFKICNLRTSPVIQWLGILLPMQRTLGRSLVWEDSRATNPRNHSYWSWSAESPSLQQEATAVRGLCTTREWPPYISEDPVYRKQNK